MTPGKVMTDFAVGVPVRNQLPFVRACLASLERHSPGVPLVLVDDASEPECRDALRDYADRSHVTLIRNDRQRGFPYNCNDILYHTDARTVCLLNSDTLVNAGWHKRVLDAMASHEAFGLAGPSTCFTHTAQQLQSLLAGRMNHNVENVAAIAEAVGQRYGESRCVLPTLGGFCLFVRRDVVTRIGYFDERFGLGCGEEDDFCYRALKAGVKPIWVQGAYGHHFGHCSFTTELGLRSGRLWARNRELLALKVAARLPEIVHPARA
jgi:GT2 family glycosyltransferase